MIQRIQSLYLLAASLVIGGAFFVDEVWTGPAATTQPWFLPVSMAILGLVAVGAFLCIFLYGNRVFQRRFVTGVQGLAIVGIAVLFGGQVMAGTLPDASARGDWIGEWVVLVMPFISYILLYLARRAIDADIKLVKSMDRLR